MTTPPARIERPYNRVERSTLPDRPQPNSATRPARRKTPAADKLAWIERVVKDPKLAAAPLRIAITLISYFDRDGRGQCYVGVERIQHELGLCESAVRKGIRRLTQHGHIVVEHRKGRTSLYGFPVRGNDDQLHYVGTGPRISREAKQRDSGTETPVRVSPEAVHDRTGKTNQNTYKETTKSALTRGAHEAGKAPGNSDLAEFWQSIQEPLRKVLGALDYKGWITLLKPFTIANGTLYLAAPSSSIRGYVEKEFSNQIENIANMKVVIETRPSLLGPA